MRLGDIDSIIMDIAKAAATADHPCVYFANDLIRILSDDEAAHVVDLTPVDKHGHWVILDECANDGWYCSECLKKIYEYKPNIKKHLKNYCPNCGAKMDFEENK